MLDLDGVYAVWLRELKVYLRERERVVASFISPLLWLFVFGNGIGKGFDGSGETYQHFIFPGIVVMGVLFVSVFYGLYIIWDRKLDFLKEVLVAPISRTSVYLGKTLGGVTDAMMQGIILLIIGMLFILPPLEPVRFAAVLVLLAGISFATTSMGLVIGANMKSQEGFILVMNFLVWPMFFFSGALFPISNLPEVLKPVSTIDPLTYGVDAMRSIMLGKGTFALEADIAALMLFTIIMVSLGIASFGRLQQAK